MNKKISFPIAIIIVIVLALLVGGIVVWQYYGMPKEEEETPEEKVIEEEKIQTGKLEIDYDRVNELQMAVDEGHQPWRLDPESVVTAEGLEYGFADNDFETMEQVFFATSAGVAKYEITHQNKTYVVTVIQPIPGEGKIWTISEIQEK